MVNRLGIVRELENYPVFNAKVLVDIVGKDRRYCWLVMHRLKKAGVIFELERNRYTTLTDSLVVASYMVWPCYISSWSAVRYYNLTEQLPSSVQVIITRPKKRRRIKFGNGTIEFIRIKKENFFGFEKIRHGDFDVFMAEKEKALADALYLKQMSFETFMEILKAHAGEIDVKKLKRYLREMGVKNGITRLEEANASD